MHRGSAQAPAPPPSPTVPPPPEKGAAEGARKRGRLTPEERAAREADKAKRAEDRARKARGEDMPCLVELQRAWRDEVARARGIRAEDVTITGRALSAARGYLGRRYEAVAGRRPLTPEDERRIVDGARALFRAALSTERPSFPVGLEIVCSNPDRFEGLGARPAPSRDGYMQPANPISDEWGKGRF